MPRAHDLERIWRTGTFEWDDPGLNERLTVFSRSARELAEDDRAEVVRPESLDSGREDRRRSATVFRY
ncbi:hypothetical protein [Arthrobacter sp. efr-133-TYG-118]|uniref:hypothetical protein n=1 Tax=Arthrobacter sp. efr-133-TYG-118 TaxID=3040279 RepID=UPI002550540E|nr:hypothetical protein [Arthrobacter sp. efr-133-TYG-118]